MKLIPLTKGQFALVDDEDFEELNRYSWRATYCRTDNRYRAVRTFKRFTNIKMHRLIMGVTDSLIQVDHKDGNTLNNQRYNLRVCNNTQNCRNKKKRKGCLSIYKGVDKCRNKWRARIHVPKEIYLGSFDQEILAAYAYNKAAIEHFGPFALLNYPNES